MKALRVSGDELSIDNVPRPAADGEALVRVLSSGICNTDLEIARGYAGFNGTIGHEFVGVVESAETGHLIGKRVVGEINAGCGKCDLCRLGDPRHCPNRTVLGIHGRDGAHAEFLRLPEVNLFEVPENVSDEAAVFVEPLAAAFGITEQVQIGPDDRAAVIGDGKLGLLCVRSLSKLTGGLTHVGKHRNKLDLGEKYGNVTGVLLDDVSHLADQFDIVIEASG
jgi:threonine dehydrogenase-like Zn-dependent dehydrogenase